MTTNFALDRMLLFPCRPSGSLASFTLLPVAVLFIVTATLTGCVTEGEVRPGITIAELQDGDVLSGTVTITANPRGLGELAGVEFYLDDNRVDTVLLKPYAATIDTEALSDGPVTLRAVAVRDGEVAAEDSVDVIVDNNGPSVSLVSPTDTTLFYSGEVALVFDIEDTSGVDLVSVTVNGLPLNVEEGPPWLSSFTLESLGVLEEELPLELVINVQATDGVFQSSETTFNLTLDSRLAWRFKTLNEIWAPPAFSPDGSTIYVGSRDSRLYALNQAGLELWRYETGAEIITRPVVTDTGDILVTAATQLHLVGPDGQQKWVYQADSTLGTSATVVGNLALVGSYGDTLVAVNLANGMEAWRFNTGDDIQSRPMVDQYGTIIFGSHDRFVYGIDQMGTELFRYETGDQVWSSPAPTADGDFLIGSNDGYLYRLNRYGTLRWEFEARGQIWGSPLEGPDGTIYVASTFRRLYALDRDGNENWNQSFSGFATTTPSVGPDGTVYVASTDGFVHALDRFGGNLWSFGTASEIIGSAVLSPDQSLLLVGSNDRHLYALRTGGSGCPAPEMVAVGDRQMMRYEASRADATDTDAGTATEAVCSRAGVLPWTNVTWTEAQAACESAGLVLCAGDLWEAGCQGPGMTDFPYGSEYMAAQCVDTDHPVGGCASGSCTAVPTGTTASCESATGVLDASGNVREWSGDQHPDGYVVRGGSYRETGDDLRCSNVFAATHVVSGDTRSADIGFRCCTP